MIAAGRAVAAIPSSATTVRGPPPELLDGLDWLCSQKTTFAPTTRIASRATCPMKSDAELKTNRLSKAGSELVLTVSASRKPVIGWAIKKTEPMANIIRAAQRW